GLHYRLAVTRLRAGRPDAGVAVGLQLHADLQRVALGLRALPLRAPDLIRNAADRLDMVTDFVRDDIGLRGIAGGTETLIEFAEKTGVEIDALIGGAIKGTHRRLRGTATRAPGRLFIEVERRLLVAVDQAAPHGVRRAEDIAG